MKYVQLTHAKQLSDYVITVYFSDGTEQTIDFEPVIMSIQGYYAKWQNPRLFKKWRLDGQNIYWGKDYDIIFDFEDVYNNTIKPMKYNLTLEQVTNGAFKNDHFDKAKQV